MDLEFIRMPVQDKRSGRVAVEAVFWFSPEDWEAAKDLILAAYDDEIPNQARMRSVLLGMFEKSGTSPIDLRPKIVPPPIEKVSPEQFRRIVGRKA